MKKLFILSIILFCSATVSACPVCSSPQATQVRNYLFGSELSTNLFSLLLPFLIFAVIAACVYYYDFPFNKNRYES